MLEADQGQSSW